MEIQNNNDKEIINPIMYAGNPDLPGTQWKIYPATAEGISEAKKAGYTAISVSEFSHPIEEGSPDPIVFGDLYLDFDAKKIVKDSLGNKQAIGDIETALKAVREFIRLLIQYYDVDPNCLKFWASGGKGFHMCIPRQMIGSEAGDVMLSAIYKAMVGDVLKCYGGDWHEMGAMESMNPKGFFERFCVDVSIYSGGKGHLIRIPHVQRPDGNYKVPVTYEEIMNEDHSYFINLVKQDRDIQGKHRDISKNDNLENLFLEKKRLLSIRELRFNSKQHARDMEINCSFFEFCRTHAEEVTEPQWFLLARILTHCGPLGISLFLEYSQKDINRFNKVEAMKKLFHAKNYNIPTCKEINEHFACGKKCGVKCPIDLFSKGMAHSIKNKKFVNSEDGLFYYPDKNDMSKFIKICSPIEILASARDNESSSWAKLIEIRDLDAILHSDLVPYKSLIGNAEEALGQILDKGLRLEPNKNAKHLLIEYLQSVNPTQRCYIVDKNGWINNEYKKYIPFDMGKQEDGSEYLIRRDGSTNSPYTQSGTLQEWKDSIGLLSRGNPLLMISILMGLSGPMLSPMGYSGFGIHFYGLTSQGKTTTMNIGASVTGAEVNKWKATVNGLENTAVEFNDNTLFLDELGEMNPDDLCYSAYMLPSGKGKIRSTKTGKNKNTATWNELFVSSGEVSIAERANEAKYNKARGGHEVRIINLIADGGTGNGIYTSIPEGFDANTFSVHLSELSAKYRGTPLIAFLKYLKVNMTQAIHIAQTAIEDFNKQIDKTNMPSTARRVLNNLAFLVGVGELAIEIGIVPWSKGEAASCVDFCFKKWLRETNIGSSYEIQEAIEKLKVLIENDFYGQINKNGQVTAVNIKGTQCYHLANPYIDRYICKPHYRKAFINELMRIDCIILKKSGEPRDSIYIDTDTRTARGICIDAEKLLLGNDRPKHDKSLHKFEPINQNSSENFNDNVF